jgi:3-deoxy-D-manno-octulosonic-acid transferase
MLQIVPRWAVTARLAARPAARDGIETKIWIDAMSMGEVLKALSAIQWSENGLEQPEVLTITLVKREQPVGVPLS